MGFLPENYKDPASGSAYIKPSELAEGSYKFRVLSTPVMGWTYWISDGDKRKPVRVKDFKEVPQSYRSPADDKDKAYYFWAFLVWNYQDSKAQIMEIKQSTIRAAIENLDKDTDWGDVREYDISITKSGQKMETEYSLNPKPRATFSKEGKDIPEVNLEALFSGNDPFIVEESVTDADLDTISKQIA